MVRITVQVSSGAIRYRVEIQAENIRRALDIAEGVNPGRKLKVTFPIDPETFFVEEPAAAVGQIEREKKPAA